MATPNDDNLILFPKWQEKLENESLQALKDKKYEEALTKLNKLIAYHVNNHEIIIGKLICLMELGRYDEVENVCEHILSKKDDHYYQYLHIYLTLLFQTSRYSLLIDIVETELSNNKLPESLKNQFTQLYDISFKMRQDAIDEKILIFEYDLNEAFKQSNYQTQWQIIERMRNLKTEPNQSIIEQLKNNEVHPVIKTSIINWLQDVHDTRHLKVVKFNNELTIKADEMLPLKENRMYKQTILVIKDIEQQNPSLYVFLEQLLYQYTYVRYPLLPNVKDVFIIAEAIKVIGNEYFDFNQDNDFETESKFVNYIEEIKLCQSLYLSIIEE